MKDSGIPWIGLIPEEWQLLPLRYAAVSIAGGATPSKDHSEFWGGNIPWASSKDLKTRRLYETEDSITEEGLSSCSASLIDKGRLILCVRSGILRHTLPACINEIPMAINQDLKAIEFRSDLDVRYVQYYFLGLNREVLTFAQKEGATVESLDMELLMKLPIWFPQPVEQKRIMAYLDARCGEIDRVIAAKERQNELLRDQRAAVIHEAVTKGLNPKAKFKESGYEWIGRVPKDWKVLKLRYVGSCQNGISKSGDLFGSGFPFVSYGDVYQNEVLPESVVGLVESTPEDQENYSVRDGDVFFTRTSETIEEIGLTSVCMKTIEKATFAGFLIRFRPFAGMLDKTFSKYYFRCIMHRGFFVKEMNIVTRASLGQDLLKKLPVLLPALPEQQQIAAHLDARCGEIDRVMAANAGMVAKLKEYRASLIWEAVTGKKCS